MTKYEKDLNRIKKKPLTIEEIRWERYGLKTLPPAIFECKNLRNLTISRNQLTAIPDDISRLENLETLYINSNLLTTLPESLLQLKKLRHLVVGMNKLTEFPTFLMEHPSLEQLHLKFNPITTIPDFKAVNTTLKRLAIGNHKLTSISPTLQQLQGLEYLDVAYGELTKLPIELGQLKELRQLDFNGNPIINFPECLQPLVHLNYLNISQTSISTIPDWMAEKQDLNIIFLANTNLKTFPAAFLPFIKTIPIHGLETLYPQLSQTDIKRLWQQIKARKGTAKEDLRYIHLFTGDERISTHSVADIIAEMQQSKEVLVAQHAIQHLTKDSEKTHPLQAGSELALLGKLDLKDLRVLKKRMKDAGLNLVKTPTENTTHWYISRKIMGEYNEQYADLPFINSEQLMQFLDEAVPQFLVEDKANVEQNAENIRRFLFASNGASQQIGFELIKNGGLPKELLTDVFYFHQTTDNAKFRTRALGIIKQHASPKLLQNLRSRKKVKDVYNSQYSFDNFQKQVIEGTELDELKILLYMVRDYGTQCYAMYPLLNHPEANPTLILKYAAADGKLQLRGEAQAELIPHLASVPHLQELELRGLKWQEFPAEVLTLTTLRSLYLREVTLEEIPEGITKLTALTTLKLELFGVKKVPNLGAMNVTELHLSFGYPDDFSAVLKNITQLKNLTITRNTTSSTLPAALADCTNLETLMLQYSKVTELSDVLLPLQKLNSLHLRYMKLKEFPMVLTKLTALRDIRVQGSTETFMLIKEQLGLLHPQLVLR